MTRHKFLFANIGYGRGIDGSISSYVARAPFHLRCPPAFQRRTLDRLRAIMRAEDVDIGCFVEVDQGNKRGAFRQLDYIAGDIYPYYEGANKYGPDSPLRHFFLTEGKSNGFVSKLPVKAEQLQFSMGIKRLLYKIQLDDRLTVFFAHFPLSARQRRRQFVELAAYCATISGDVIVFGDFNILSGPAELAHFLHSSQLILLNDPSISTFRLHRTERMLDLCFVSRTLKEKVKLAVVPQPYSDHAALLLELID